MSEHQNICLTWGRDKEKKKHRLHQQATMNHCSAYLNRPFAQLKVEHKSDLVIFFSGALRQKGAVAQRRGPSASTAVASLGNVAQREHESVD